MYRSLEYVRGTVLFFLGLIFFGSLFLSCCCLSFSLSFCLIIFSFLFFSCYFFCLLFEQDNFFKYKLFPTSSTKKIFINSTTINTFCTFIATITKSITMDLTFKTFKT